MNVMREYNVAFFGNGAKIDPTLYIDQENKTLLLTGDISVKEVQDNTQVHAFSNTGRYLITYVCPFKYLERDNADQYLLRLVSIKFFRNVDHESDV